MVSGMPILLSAGSWDNTIRIWKINENETIEPKAIQNIGAPVLALDWFDVFFNFILTFSKLIKKVYIKIF